MHSNGDGFDVDCDQVADDEDLPLLIQGSLPVPPGFEVGPWKNRMSICKKVQQHRQEKKDINHFKNQFFYGKWNLTKLQLICTADDPLDNRRSSSSSSLLSPTYDKC